MEGGLNVVGEALGKLKGSGDLRKSRLSDLKGRERSRLCVAFHIS